MSEGSDHSRIVLVMAKTPVPGRVKTRLCPPLSSEGAASLAAAALADTLESVRNTPDSLRVLALSGSIDELNGLDIDGFDIIQQRGEDFGERLSHAFADAQGTESLPTLLVGMDTPQLRADHLETAFKALQDSDCAIGSAVDGGWWLLALNDPSLAAVLIDVPMSTELTGVRTQAALRGRGSSVVEVGLMVDVDTIEDARDVAALTPESLFALVLRQLDSGQSP